MTKQRNPTDAWINAVAEECTRAEVVEYLIEAWDGFKDQARLLAKIKTQAVRDGYSPEYFDNGVLTKRKAGVD